MPDFQEHLDGAREAMDAGDANAAFQNLRWVFQDLTLAERNRDLTEALAALATITEAMDAKELVTPIKECIKNPNDAQALLDVATAFNDEQGHDVAACLLMRVRQLVPDQIEVVLFLAAALEAQDRFADAYRILQEDAPRHGSDFYYRYLLAFNAIMCADLHSAQSIAARLRHPPDDDHRFLAERISAMLARSEEVRSVCNLGPEDLRGWHYVITGGLLLHLSPFGLDEGMNGRYAMTQDSYERCREGIERLRIALHLLNLRPQRVLSLSERGSLILSLAAGKIMNLPVASWSESQEGLVIAYDLTELDEKSARVLHDHRPGQILYSHGTCWTSSFPYLADITNYLFQFNRAPWEEHLRVIEHEVKTLPADEGAPEDLAAKVVNAKLGEDELRDVDQMKAMVSAVGCNAAIRKPGGQRSQLWTGPVRSSRFC